MGFPGHTLSDDSAAFISQAGIGGVIVFGHNYQNPRQVAELITQVQACRNGLPLWVSVDQEGGKVQRFKEGFTKIPEAAVLGAKDSPKLLFELSEMMARELAAVGANLNYAPVADIHSNPANPVIGRRAFGTSEDMVSKMVSSFVRGHLTQGVQPCVKHFPGHGDTQTDSHFALPKVEDSLDSLRAREFKPFVKGFKSGCRFVMTAHMLNPNLDPEVCATFSRFTLQDVLRKELRYTGIIISDDLEMKAVTDHFGAEDAPRMALQAGCDLLIYRTENGARHAYTSLLKDLDNGKLAPDVILGAAQRLREFKSEVLMPYEAPVLEEIKNLVGTAENQALVEKFL